MQDIGAETSVDHQRRFGGLARLYGTAGAVNIFSSHVVVIGIGGVGSWSAESLARSGVGRITLIDMDHVSESNINRQIHSLDSTLGKAKIEAMRDRMLDINPHCQVHLVDDFVTPDNWGSLLSHIQVFTPPDAVIDACDQVATKTAIAAWAIQQKNRLFITVGAAGGKQQAERVQINDLSQTTHDPLLAKMRYNLRRNHGSLRQGKMGIACVYSQEAVQMPTQSQSTAIDACTAGGVDAITDGSLNCHGFGSVVSVTATFGLCAAGWIINSLAKTDKTTL
jgi:tRNA A37 threonylcarbamoyladenosine dehydratase